jgi:hypothetical protein
VADVAVEFRITDDEPFWSFTTGVTEALGEFGTLDDRQLAALPEGFRRGIERLHAACKGIGAERPVTARNPPENGYRGAVIIEWPGPPKHGVGPVRACLAAVYDAFTGDSPDPKMIPVTEITVHAPADGFVTADLTMFADADGNPSYTGMPVVRDGEIITATFPFRVAEMRIRP